MGKIKNQRGEGEAGFLMMVFGGAIVISAVYFTIGFIQSVKAARAHYGDKKVNQTPPPTSLEEMGSFEVTYTGLFWN